MADPQLLYIVTGVVVVGLIAWVAAVLARAPKYETRYIAPEEAAVLAGAGAVAAVASARSSDPPQSAPVSTSQSSQSSPPRSSSSRSSAAPAKPASIPSPEVRVDVEEEEQPTGPHALILVTAVGRTDPGLKRPHNEDAYAILENHKLFVIADGMGRHAAGEIASQLCIEAITEAFNHGNPPGPPSNLPQRATRLKNAILLANTAILKAAQANEAYAGMGTTVVTAYFSQSNQRVYIAHVGDSRCYRLRAGRLTQLTTDHTLGAAGIQGKTSNVLSRAVGVEPSVDVDLTMESPLPGDMYLLCSDGLSRMVESPEIEQTMASNPDLNVAVAKLIDTANARGGRDNITAILVRVDDARPSQIMRASTT